MLGLKINISNIQIKYDGNAHYEIAFSNITSCIQEQCHSISLQGDVFYD